MARREQTRNVVTSKEVGRRDFPVGSRQLVSI